MMLNLLLFRHRQKLQSGFKQVLLLFVCLASRRPGEQSELISVLQASYWGRMEIMAVWAPRLIGTGWKAAIHLHLVI